MRFIRQHMTKKWLMLSIWMCFANVYAHAQFNPNNVGGLRMWLRSDQGIELNGNFVSQWSDQSGSNNHALSSPDAYRPVFTPNAINGLPALSFDGEDDYLQFPEITNVRTVFWVIREHPLATNATSRPLLGWNGGLNFLRGDNMQLWNGQYSAPQVYNGQTRLNGTNVVGSNTLLIPGFNVVSLRTTGDIQASHLTQENNTFYRTWWGDFAEILIYDQPLSDQEIAQIENYLFDKYVPSYQPFADIDRGGSLCDTTLCIPSAFTDVVWNGTMNAPCLNVNASGVYTVSFKDIFQRTYYDTVEVSFAFDNQTVLDTFCLGQTFQWNTSTYSFDYTINGQIVTNTELQEAGSYAIEVMDAQGCAKSFTLELTGDDFAETHHIATQGVYCSGAVLQIAPQLPQDANVIWNNTITEPVIEVTASGEYIVMATNALGCIMYDSLDIVLAGASSVVQLQIDGQCIGTAVSFNTVVVEGENIVSGGWSFGDDNVAQVIEVSHTYESAGNYEVQFTGINASGCESYAAAEVVIHAAPELGITGAGQCSNAPIIFDAVAVSNDGAITSYDWLVNGDFLEGQQIEIITNTSGTLGLVVGATTEFGCFSEVSQNWTVFAPPTVSASASPVCLGELTQMQWDLINSGNGNSGLSVGWYFGDGAQSNQTDPFHYYTYPGSYQATVISTNSSGCSDSTLVNTVVFDLPNADYLISNFCSGEEQQMLDISEAVEGDPIVSWLWTIDNTTQLTGQQPMVTLSELGLHAIKLEVNTVAGCAAQVEQQVPVWPKPSVQFTWSPLIAGAPWEVTLTATADRPVGFAWDFGDETNGNGATVQHTYLENGSYNVIMTGTTPQGCSAALTKTLIVAEPVKDLVVETMELQPTEDGSIIQVRVRNQGNVILEEVLMSWQMGGDAGVIEKWMVDLAPGATAIYTFNSRASVTDAQLPYLCVYAETSPFLVTEVNLTDNAYCKPLQTGGLELLPPFPNPGDERMFIRLISPNSGLAHMQVVDQKGAVVMVFDDLDVSKGFQQFFIDISSLSNGPYQLAIVMGQAKSVVSFLKLARK